jgi:hypothetical protein
MEGMQGLEGLQLIVIQAPSVGKFIDVPDHYTTRELRQPFVTNLVRS